MYIYIYIHVFAIVNLCMHKLSYVYIHDKLLYLYTHDKNEHMYVDGMNLSSSRNHVFVMRYTYV